jgi:hypothetical protein
MEPHFTMKVTRFIIFSLSINQGTMLTTVKVMDMVASLLSLNFITNTKLATLLNRKSLLLNYPFIMGRAVHGAFLVMTQIMVATPLAIVPLVYTLVKRIEKV